MGSCVQSFRQAPCLGLGPLTWKNGGIPSAIPVIGSGGSSGLEICSQSPCCSKNGRDSNEKAQVSYRRFRLPGTSSVPAGRPVGRLAVTAGVVGRQLVECRMIVVNCDTDLLEVVTATHSSSGLTCGLNRRQKQADQHANDGDDDEEFHKCEPPLHGFSHERTFKKREQKRKFEVSFTSDVVNCTEFELHSDNKPKRSATSVEPKCSANSISNYSPSSTCSCSAFATSGLSARNCVNSS